MPVQETKEKVVSGGETLCARTRARRDGSSHGGGDGAALWEGRGGGDMVPGEWGGGGWWWWGSMVLSVSWVSNQVPIRGRISTSPLLRKGGTAVGTRQGDGIESRSHRSFNAADGCDSARQLRRLQPPSSGKGDGGVEVLERRKRLAERWGRSTLLACPCASRSLADSVKGRHKDGSERNAGLAGFSVLNTSGSGAVGPGIGDRPAGGPVGGAEKTAGRERSLGIGVAAAAGPCLFGGEGLSWRAAATGGVGRKRRPPFEKD